MDAQKLLLLEVLRAAADPPGEKRLYRRGKLPGLFATRTRSHAACADVAVRAGLLEIAKVETRGRAIVEWVRITPQGMDYLLQHESPVRVLEELRAVLAVSDHNLPIWVAELRSGIEALQERLDTELDRIQHRLDEVTRRALAAIERLEETHAPDGSATPWAADALAYLEHKQQAGLGDYCALRELYGVLRAKLGDVSLKDFHAGLRRLYDRGRVRLLSADDTGQVAEPEYALLDGPAVYHFVAKAG